MRGSRALWRLQGHVTVTCTEQRISDAELGWGCMQLGVSRLPILAQMALFSDDSDDSDQNYMSIRAAWAHRRPLQPALR